MFHIEQTPKERHLSRGSFLYLTEKSTDSKLKTSLLTVDFCLKGGDTYVS